jgi:hypothetical protein
MVATAHGAVQRFEETRELDSVRKKLDRATVRFQVLEERAHSFEIPRSHRFIPLGKHEEPITGCSGVFISEKGYLLTAQHCLINELTDYSLQNKLENTRFDDYQRQFKLLSSFNFRLRIWTSSIFGRSSKDYDARIIGTGPFRNVLKYIKGLPASSYRQLNEGMRPALDFIEKGYGVVSSDWPYRQSLGRLSRNYHNRCKCSLPWLFLLARCSKDSDKLKLLAFRSA